MFGVIIITFVITGLGMLVLFLINGNQKHTTENTRLKRENDGLYRQVNDFREQEHGRRERQAYDKGLYDGRQTDTLYRKMLSRYSSGEQVTVILTGEETQGKFERRTRV